MGSKHDMSITNELTTLSDHVLRWLITEEEISAAFRALILTELESREHPEEPVELTAENLSALFNCNAPNRRQMILLGIRYPLVSGWMKKIVGQTIPARVYKAALACKGRKPKSVTKREWRNAPA